MFDLERIYENEMKEMLFVCNPNKSVHVSLKNYASLKLCLSKTPCWNKIALFIFFYFY